MSRKVHLERGIRKLIRKSVSFIKKEIKRKIKKGDSETAMGFVLVEGPAKFDFSQEDIKKIKENKRIYKKEISKKLWDAEITLKFEESSVRIYYVVFIDTTA